VDANSLWFTFELKCMSSSLEAAIQDLLADGTPNHIIRALRDRY